MAESPSPSPVVSNINVRLAPSVQLSVEPLFNWDAFTVTFPVESRSTVILAIEAVGITESSTVIVASPE